MPLDTDGAVARCQSIMLSPTTRGPNDAIIALDLPPSMHNISLSGLLFRVVINFT